MALVRKWRLMSENSGVTPSAIADGLDGTLSPSYPSIAPIIAGGVSSSFPNSMLFDGSNGYVSLPTGSGTLGAAFAISAWVYAKDLNRRTIFSTEAGSLQPNIGFSTAGGVGSLEVVVVGQYVSLSSAGVVEANKWTNVIWSCIEGVQSQFYVNGSAVETSFSPSWVFDKTPRIAYVGCRFPRSQHWNGRICEVSVFDSGLDAAGAWAVYQEGLRDNACFLGQP